VITSLTVIDDAIPLVDAINAREHVLARGAFETHRGPDGAEYGMTCVQCPVDGLLKAVETAIRSPIQIVTAVWRLACRGDDDDTFCHVDTTYASWTAVWYASAPRFDGVGGTSFWRHKLLGIDHMPSDANIGRVCHAEGFHTLMTRATHFDQADSWELCGFAGLKFNRLVIYPANRFHSRSPNHIRSPFGQAKEDGRLIRCLFFDLPDTTAGEVVQTSVDRLHEELSTRAHV
jgi:hypothetical protein